MPNIDDLVYALQETTVAQHVALAHDEARARYRLNRNTVPNWEAFQDVIADYYSYHYGACVAPGARLSRTEALGQAKELLEREYRRRRSDITGALSDAMDGTGGGLRVVLDTLAEGLKAMSVERYVQDQFDRRIAPNDYEAKVDIIRQFISRFGAQLGATIQQSRPERYAQNYQDLIRAYVNGLQQTSSMFRRL